MRTSEVLCTHNVAVRSYSKYICLSLSFQSQRQSLRNYAYPFPNAVVCTTSFLIHTKQYSTDLECITLARDPVRLALADDLLAKPFSLETAVQDVQILDDILAASDDSLFWCNCAVGLYTEFEGREKRVGHLVGGEDDVLVLEQALRKEVAKRVILLVECEDGSVGHT